MKYGEHYCLPARQVLHVAVHSALSYRDPPSPALLSLFFPTASISSLDITISQTSYPLLSLFDVLDQNITFLRLRCDDRVNLHDQIDHLLPKFAKLRHLDLDPPFRSDSFQTHLPSLSNLVSLSLAYTDQTPNLDHLLSRLDSLRHLCRLDLTYLNIASGENFSIEQAQREFDWGDDSGNHLSLIRNVDDLADMYDWSLPWSLTISDTLPQVIEMEKKAREAHLIVESNLEELIENFECKIVECYNRGVGDLYFYGRKYLLRYALSLAEKHGLDIDISEINLDENFKREDLKWFKDSLKGVGRMVDKWHTLYGLELKMPPKGEDWESENEEESDWED
ncbi:uncharacterized protein JCM6883_005591 [Sporobolomyces salmoneus]|uniref:uncharacterized protein n=1 Tax=Sporobolomyces salmoneus TaxID=183962 RepID=UPI00317E83B3